MDKKVATKPKIIWNVATNVLELCSKCSYKLIMGKTNPIGVRFDTELLEKVKELGKADSPQKALNLYEKTFREKDLGEVVEEPTEKPEYDFGNDQLLYLEKFTKFPTKDKPIGWGAKKEWEKQKALSDQPIKDAWAKHLKTKKNEKD